MGTVEKASFTAVSLVVLVTYSSYIFGEGSLGSLHPKNHPVPPQLRFGVIWTPKSIPINHQTSGGMTGCLGTEDETNLMNIFFNLLETILPRHQSSYSQLMIWDVQSPKRNA